MLDEGIVLDDSACREGVHPRAARGSIGSESIGRECRVQALWGGKE